MNIYKVTTEIRLRISNLDAMMEGADGDEWISMNGAMAELASLLQWILKEAEQ